MDYLNCVLHKAAIAIKLKYVETRSSAYNTSAAGMSTLIQGSFTDEIKINLNFL